MNFTEKHGKGNLNAAHQRSEIILVPLIETFFIFVTIESSLLESFRRYRCWSNLRLMSIEIRWSREKYQENQEHIKEESKNLEPSDKI